MTHDSSIAVKHSRRNWLAFFGDYLSFGLGLTFASTATTLPAFAATLTENKVLIGAVSAVWVGGWLLPQVLAANYLSNKPRKYPILIGWQFLGRSVFPLFVIWMLAGGIRYPQLTLFLFLAMLGIFAATDALVALAWFDLFGKSLAPETRGRLIGMGQVIIGLSAFGVGAWIQHLLGPSGPAYPLNYTVIFGLASACYGISALCNVFIVEPPEAVAEIRPSLRDYLPQLMRLWREEEAFSRVTTVRLLSGLGGLAVTFYVVYATEVLRLPPQSIGLFAAADTLGIALAGIVLGLVANRVGSHRVVQIVTWSYFAVPVLAWLCTAGIFGSALPIVYLVLYVLLGIFEGSFMLGFLNFVLEIAPPGQRPTYMGLTNTIAGLLVVMPLVGGFILERTSYPVLFSLAATGTLFSALLALRLPNPRQPLAQPPKPEAQVEASPAP